MRTIGTDKNGNEIAEVSVTELDTMFKEIRNKAIDEFVKVMKKTYPLAENDLFTINDTLHRTLDKIAEQMKGK